MITLFAQNAVEDFDAWLEAARQHQHDEPPAYVETHVYRMEGGQGIIVTHTFNTWEDAQEFKTMAESDEFQAAVQQMGGKLPITVWLAEEVSF